MRRRVARRREIRARRRAGAIAARARLGAGFGLGEWSADMKGIPGAGRGRGCAGKDPPALGGPVGNGRTGRPKPTHGAPPPHTSGSPSESVGAADSGCCRGTRGRRVRGFPDERRRAVSGRTRARPSQPNPSADCQTRGEVPGPAGWAPAGPGAADDWESAYERGRRVGETRPRSPGPGARRLPSGRRVRARCAEDVRSGARAGARLLPAGHRGHRGRRARGPAGRTRPPHVLHCERSPGRTENS